MSTAPAPEPFRYATTYQLEAMEGRMIQRDAEMELRLIRELNTAFWRMVALILPVYLFLAGTILSIVLFSVNIIDRLARIEARP